MDRVIGAACSVLAQARVRLSQIRAEGEDPLVVQLELTPGRADEQAERVLVYRAGAGAPTLGRDRILAWPVPFALLTGSDNPREKENAGSFRTPVVSEAHKPRPNETSTKEDMPQ